MPAGYEGMMPEQGGLFDQGPQMRDVLAQIMQAQQGMPPPPQGQPPFPASPDPRYTPEVEDRFQKFIGRDVPQVPPAAMPQEQQVPPAAMPQAPGVPGKEDTALQQFLQREQQPQMPQPQPQVPGKEDTALQQFLQREQQQRRSQFALPGQ